MELMTASQAEQAPFERQYRHSIAIALGGFLVLAAITGALAYAAYTAWFADSIGISLFLLWLSIWSGLFTLLLLKFLRQRLRPSNWLVRVHPDGLSIKFRSYLNDHFYSGDEVVIRLSYAEFDFVRDSRIRQETPGFGRGEIESRYLRFAEFKLRSDEALRQIERETATERARQAPAVGRWIRRRTKFGDHSVQVQNGFLRVHWRVRPRLDAFLGDIAPRIEVRDAVRAAENFTTLRKAPTARQQELLLKIMASGDRLAAIRLIRQLYGYDLTQAVTFYDELSKPTAPETIERRPER
ncbi:MAG TPA: hypothetical protein VFY29_18185 [Terriglobia bacterium]|nr:hypothetical protein [Terriglobia bacterium]